MAKVKYSTGTDPLRNEHKGFTFQNSRSGATMMKSQANDRARNIAQKNKQVNILKAVRGWRQMSAENKLAWTKFATTYPQPCKKDATKYLSGYQLFLKRNHYLFLNEGITEPFMEAPLMNALSLSTINFSVSQMDNCADVTEAYLKNFGMLPTPGDIVLFQCLPMAVNTGQFFTPIKQQLSVTTTYFDGMFLSFILPPSLDNIVFSIYLSKPINQSVNYTGTKVRYMGCFTTKTFLSLTDTPSSYAGAAGKVATVNALETALVFTTPGGGGLTCADLVNCPTIINMNLTDQQIIAILMAAGLYNPFGNSGNGALYKWHAVNLADFAPVGWHVATNAEWTAMVASLGGSSFAGPKLRSTDQIHWTPPNSFSTNISGFTGFGSGLVLPAGTFSYLLNYGFYWTATQYDANTAYDWGLLLSPNNTAGNRDDKNAGASVRIVKDNSVNPGTVTDIDGNFYNCVTINSKVWTTSNYKCTHSNSGILIPTLTTAAAWLASTSAAMCYYNFDIRYR